MLIALNPGTHLFRGEFIDLNGGADFYASDVKSLRREGEISLHIFLVMCNEGSVERRKNYFGKLMVRLPAELYEKAAVFAASQERSLNAWLTDIVMQAAV